MPLPSIQRDWIDGGRLGRCNSPVAKEQFRQFERGPAPILEEQRQQQIAARVEIQPVVLAFDIELKRVEL